MTEHKNSKNQDGGRPEWPSRPLADKMVTNMAGDVKMATRDKDKMAATDGSQEADSLNVNASAVSGMIATGAGYSQLEEICAALNMPCISTDTWNTYQDQVSETIHVTAWELMTEAVKEEVTLAKEVGELDKEGYLLITFVADRAWAKRSYKTKYDSLSGVGDSMPEHKCAKNWTGTSSSMEQDIIVNSFVQSMNMRGLRYNKLIVQTLRNRFGPTAGIWQEPLIPVQHVASRATSLILDVGTNIYENFNSVVARTKGGKCINFTLRNSYQTRCEATVVSVNSKGGLHRVVHMSAVNKSPAPYEKVCDRIISQRRRRLAFQNKRKGSAAQSYSADLDYGPVAYRIEDDVSEKDYEGKKERNIFISVNARR
ncbi:hypothetical protein PR048_008142 [Dryococelus australis]|uniref:Mutator-like transposase domain-containing protein n=1 Tax=Dryococelus australis TaxID=614101 RepID=A0ABQ9HWD9_9NEOP|nr:hypothetical protein PR048_008142 [Dryococelus australis]